MTAHRPQRTARVSVLKRRVLSLRRRIAPNDQIVLAGASLMRLPKAHPSRIWFESQLETTTDLYDRAHRVTQLTAATNEQPSRVRIAPARIVGPGRSRARRYPRCYMCGPRLRRVSFETIFERTDALQRELTRSLGSALSLTASTRTVGETIEAIRDDIRLRDLIEPTSTRQVIRDTADNARADSWAQSRGASLP